MHILARIRTGEWAVLLLLAFSTLWKGGKSLESTWLLSGVAALLTISYWFGRSVQKKDTERQLEFKQGLASPRPELPMTLWAIALLYIAWAVVSYIFSETRNYGLDEVMRSAAFMLIFLWVARREIEQTGSLMRLWLPRVVTAVTAVACLIGTAVYIYQPVNRFVGTFFDHRFHTDYWPNAWADYLLLAWPIILFLAWRQSSEYRRWMLLTLLGCTIGCLFLSYSRGAFLSFIAQIGMAMILFGSVMLRDIRYRRQWKTVVRSLLLKGGYILAVAVLTFAAVNALRAPNFAVESLTKKATFTAAEGRSSINERASFWEQAQILALQKPLTGWGPYSFRFVQPAFMEHVLATSDHPHNVLLKLAMERGIPAAILFAAVFGSVLGISVLSFFTARKASNPENDMLTIMLTGAITGMLLHNFIDFNLQFIGISLLAILLLGLLVTPATPVITTPAESFRRWRIRRILSHTDILVSLLLLTLAFWEGIFLVTSSFGRHALAADDAPAALSWFERSHGEIFSRDLFLSEAQLHLGNASYEDAMADIDRYIGLNPHDPRGWKIRGEILLRSGESRLAVQALEEAFTRGAYTDLGITGLLLEAVREAGMEADYLPRKQALDELYTAYADAVEQNTHFIALSQNVEELQRVSRLLSDLFPLDSAQYRSIARDAVTHAKKERETFSARTGGMLW